MKHQKITMSVQQLLSMSKGEARLDSIMDQTLDFLRPPGRGKYDTKGNFDPQAPLYGEQVIPSGPAHRRVRASIYTTIQWTQGLAFIMHKLDDAGVHFHENGNLIYKDVNIRRSQQLFNERCKANGKHLGETLTTVTSWAATNTTRNRVYVRDTVGSVAEYYGIWQLYQDTSGQAMISAGCVLLKFTNDVLDKMPDLE